MKVEKPIFKIQYNGKDITADLSAHLIGVTYTDNVIGKSDEMEFSVQDADAVWRNEWYPTKGDRLHLQMGYDDLLVDCSDFVIDEIEMTGPPDVVTIKSLATWVTTPLRTRNSGAFENQTLRQIAQQIATKNGLTLDDGSTIRTGTKNQIKVDVSKEKTDLSYEATFLRTATSGSDGTLGGALEGSQTVARITADTLRKKGYSDEPAKLQDIALNMQEAAADGDRATRISVMQQSADEFDKISKSLTSTLKTTVNRPAYNGALYTIRLVRSTQNNETDLEYLRRLGEEYGFIFTVLGTKLVAQSLFDIEAGNPVFSISRSELKSYSLKDKTSLSFKDCKVISHNPTTRKTANFTLNDVKNGDGIEFKEATASDTLVIKTRSENQQQAEQKARVALYKSKTQQIEGSIEVVGNPLFVAGNNFELTDMGQLSGKYHIMKSTHAMDRSNGYVTTLEIKRVGYVSLVKNKKPRKKKPASYHVEVVK